MKLIIILFIISLSAHARWATKEDFDYWLEKEEAQYRVMKNGQYGVSLTFDYEVLREKGREHFSLFKIPFSGKSTIIKVLEARVTNGEGYLNADLSKIQERVVGNERGLSNMKELQIALPDVQVGSKIHLKYLMVAKEVPVAGHFSTLYKIGEMEQADVSEMSLDSEIPLHFSLNDPFRVLDLAEKTENGKFHYKIKLKEAYNRRAVDEMSVLGLDKATGAIISSDKDWTKISNNFRGRFEKVLSKSLPPQLDSVIQEAAKKTTTSDRVNVLLGYMTKTFNYVGDWRTIEGGFTPRSYDKILKAKHGDCKDFALVLTGMLRKLGFKADVALVYRTPTSAYTYTLDYTLPSVMLFNHAIVRMVDNNQTYWLDPTNEVSYGLYHRDDIAGKGALALDGKSVLETIPMASSAPKHIVMKKTVTLEQEGKGVVSAELDINGLFATAISSIGSKNGKDKAEQFLLRMINQGEKPLLPEFSVLDFSSRQYKPVQTKISYSASDFTHKVKEEYFFGLPQMHLFLMPFLANTRNWVGDLHLGEALQFERTVMMNNVFVNKKLKGCEITTDWVDIKREFEYLPEGLKLTEKIVTKKDIIRNSEFKRQDYELLHVQIYGCLSETAVAITPGSKKHSDPFSEYEEQIAKISAGERGQKRWEIAGQMQDTGKFSNEEILGFLEKNLTEAPQHVRTYQMMKNIILSMGYYNGDKYNKANVIEADKILDLGLKNIPNHQGFIIAKLLNQYYLGNLQAAMEGLTSVKVSEVKDPYDLGRLAKLYGVFQMKDKIPATLDLALQSAKTDNERRYVWFNKANAASDNDDYLGCIHAYKEVFKYDPEDAYSHINIINCYSDAKLFDEGIEMARKGREITQAGMMMRVSALIHNARGRFYLKQNKLDLAEKDFKESLQLQQTEYAYTGLTELALEKKDVERAFTLLNKGLKYVDGDPGKYVFRSWSHFKKQSEDIFLRYLTKSMEVSKSPFVTCYSANSIAAVYERQNRPTEMMDYLNRA